MRWSRSPNTALYGPLGCPYWYPNITWFSLPRAPRAGGGQKRSSSYKLYPKERVYLRYFGLYFITMLITLGTSPKITFLQHHSSAYSCPHPTYSAYRLRGAILTIFW